MITDRQLACFVSNSIFIREVADGLFRIAAEMMAESLVIKSYPGSTPIEIAFADKREIIANQILSEQGITTQPNAGMTNIYGTATGGSKAMDYIVRRLLNMPTWTLTPDTWASDRAAALSEIYTRTKELINALTAIPTV